MGAFVCRTSCGGPAAVEATLPRLPWRRSLSPEDPWANQTDEPPLDRITRHGTPRCASPAELAAAAAELIPVVGPFAGLFTKRSMAKIREERERRVSVALRRRSATLACLVRNSAMR
jgi:hypothetical protein